MNRQGQGGAELFEAEALLGEPALVPLRPGFERIAAELVTTAGRHRPAPAGEAAALGFSIRAGDTIADAQPMAPRPWLVGEDAGGLAAAMPGKLTIRRQGVDGFAQRKLGTTPDAGCDQGEGGSKRAAEQGRQLCWDLLVPQIHEVAFPPKAVDALLNLMAT